MHVLVAYASKYGSTEEIARFVTDRLRDRGLSVTIERVDRVDDASAFDAFVVGSAVYIGHWLKPAVDFVTDAQQLLRQRPTWLFSSGPLGTESREAHEDTGAGAERPTDIVQLGEAIAVKDHAVFDGVLDPSRLSLGHKVVRAMPAGRALLPEGDFREWPVIEAWANGIADELMAATVGA